MLLQFLKHLFIKIFFSKTYFFAVDVSHVLCTNVSEKQKFNYFSCLEHWTIWVNTRIVSELMRIHIILKCMCGYFFFTLKYQQLDVVDWLRMIFVNSSLGRILNELIDLLIDQVISSFMYYNSLLIQSLHSSLK